MVVAEPPLCSSGGNLSGRDAKGRREGRDRSGFSSSLSLLLLHVLSKSNRPQPRNSS